MGRWRPPAEKSSPYITASGKQRLQRELDGLWDKRKDVTEALAAAAAEGDRSENAEYIYRKKQLREMDRRIRYLQKRIPDLIAVNTTPDDPNKVYFSASASLENEDGETKQYRIVGADEFDPKKNWISIDSPMAKALMGKSLDDEIHVDTPSGKHSYFIVAINYE